MVSKTFVSFLFLALAWAHAGAQSVFINEIHYDDDSGDLNEGFEIAAPAGTDLACYKVILYNGANGLAYATIPLSGIVPDQCNGFGTVWFNQAPVQNGSPDGIALVYDPSLPGCTGGGPLSVIQFLSYEGAFTAADGDAVGMTSTDIGVNETNSTPAGSSLQLTGNGTVYGNFSWTGPGAHTNGALNTGQTFNGVCGGTSASQLTFTVTPTGCTLPGGTFSVTVCATDAAENVDVTYTGNITVSKNAGPGNLSGTTTVAAVNGCATFNNFVFDAAGVHTLNATDGTINGTSTGFTINSQCSTCPYLSGAFVDACGANEGNNEILFFNTGDFTLPVEPGALSLDYGTTNPPATNYTSGFTTNQAWIDSLNAQAGCSPTLFTDGLSASPLPPNSQFMVVRYDPINIYDFSGWCGQGPIYVVFTTDPDWNTTGNFKNCTDCGGSGADPRFFRMNSTALTGGGACDLTYSYTPCSDLVCSGDGDGLTFGPGGGSPTASWNECTPASVLPVSFALPLEGRYEGNAVRLHWATAQETNSDHFVIERSGTRQRGFSVIGRMPAAGSSSGFLPYTFLDRAPLSGTAFYRLRQVDRNGEFLLSNIVHVTAGDISAALSVRTHPGGDRITLDLTGEGPASLRLHATDGKTVLTRALGEVRGFAEFDVDVRRLPAGIYIYEVAVSQEVMHGKVFVFR